MYLNKLDLKDYLKNFDIKPDKLGENLYENYQNNESDQYSIDPVAPDEEFVCKAFPDSQSVLQKEECFTKNLRKANAYYELKNKADFTASLLLTIVKNFLLN
ncbi:unnamed protein product [Rotaria sp. Silwood1]|nr:unnamed protein product [Rotaria sp. Silwood1]CAF5037472.1 unnamed protein product [Rotaria sp. Silwood1]